MMLYELIGKWPPIATRRGATVAAAGRRCNSKQREKR
jgi:hypothetical protein